MKYLIELSDLSLNEQIKLAKQTKDIGLLTLFSEHEYTAVRIGVAENPITTSEILKKLSEDRIWNVRLAIVPHPNMTEEILKKLSKDANCYVKIAVKKLMQEG